MNTKWKWPFVLLVYSLVSLTVGFCLVGGVKRLGDQDTDVLPALQWADGAQTLYWTAVALALLSAFAYFIYEGPKAREARRWRRLCRRRFAAQRARLIAGDNSHP